MIDNELAFALSLSLNEHSNANSHIGERARDREPSRTKEEYELSRAIELSLLDNAPNSVAHSSSDSSFTTSTDVLPMHRGKTLAEKKNTTLFAPTLLDESVESLQPKQLQRFLYDAMPTVTQSTLRDWLSTYVLVETNKKQSLAKMLSEARADPQLGNNNKKRLRTPLNADIVAALDENAQKKRATQSFMAELATIEPVQEEEEGIKRKCVVCFDLYRAEHTVQCLAPSDADQSHRICRPCFVSYCRTTEANSLESLRCPAIECKRHYDRALLLANLPSDVVDTLQRKQTAIDQSVAVQSGVKATLYCECGVVGVIEQRDIGSGVVQCQCKLEYCIECGNYSHLDRACPPSADTIQWMSKNDSKQCPNCGEGIEKNGGCIHMTCGRCRHDFCWRCLGPYPDCNCVAKRRRPTE